MKYKSSVTDGPTSCCFLLSCDVFVKASREEHRIGGWRTLPAAALAAFLNAFPCAPFSERITSCQVDYLAILLLPHVLSHYTATSRTIVMSGSPASRGIPLTAYLEPATMPLWSPLCWLKQRKLLFCGLSVQPRIFPSNITSYLTLYEAKLT
jgi:hypothetical protein